ncbi:phosphatidylserine decarboxylase, putative [Aspergillus udagawae]|nr:phosphatidylserine decarboxylase, putative [Aspergillus udagawae]
MLPHSMFDEVPEKAPYDRDPTTLKKHVRNYETMLYLFNTLLTEVPEYFLVDSPDVPSGLIGFPFNVIVDWPMGTESGRQFFLDPRVNKSLKAILNKWNEFLSNPKGRTGGEGGGNQALIDAGWSSDIAVQQLMPHLETRALVNACESFPLSFDTDVSGRTTFWLKGMPYSLHDMLGATQDTRVRQYVDKFVGGTVYQAFLSADSYHCWNAPVNGKVVYRSLIDGTYFAEKAAAGFGGSSGPDPAGPNMSQRYITHIAARAVLIVDTNVENGSQIGLVGFVPIGMSEVSTCQWEDSTAEGTLSPREILSGHSIVVDQLTALSLSVNMQGG